MRTMPAVLTLRRNRGTTLIEVLVTVAILSIGLMPLLALQARLEIAGLEAYQRAQALVLLEDMASRIANNRAAAAGYVTTTPVGAGVTCPSTSTTRQQIDLKEWCDALQGASETSASSRLGAMLGGRGCIASLGNGDYLLTVAWQGMGPIAAPPAGVACGKDSYNGDTGTPCANDQCRRTVTTLIRFAAL
ncbi:prepilin-type N-terminal cleavage/methylation domain-containing protein [uncultured Thiodictyon sp.]|uniref:prepilin-type N-terminal cleavage/methylation domain-containing protein n=1 Tax=uncultured Thiodictyon sp. TaxID=1846217 RepID=UPI0025F68B40|nr:prepilin-type N-terminal cleavage/methylation domain-containing protein [uncultured Thiodictyon sp.]